MNGDRPLQTTHTWDVLSRGERVILALVGLGFLVLVLFARHLTPDPRGLGTHEQLGFPPCATSLFLGVPCPFCGMTTAFSLMAHGRPVAAFEVQPAGAFIFLVCIAGFFLSLGFAVAGRWPSYLLQNRYVAWLWILGLTVLGLAWVYKLILEIGFH